MIRAEAHPDDHAIEAHFDATKWFEQATDEDILKLARCNAIHCPLEWKDTTVWGQDYPADNVAHFMSDFDKKLATMFTYHEVSQKVNKQGFECYVHGEDAKAWVAKHRPNLEEHVNAIDDDEEEDFLAEVQRRDEKRCSD